LGHFEVKTRFSGPDVSEISDFGTFGIEFYGLGTLNKLLC